MNKTILTVEQVQAMATNLASRIVSSFNHRRDHMKVYAIPRGGVPVAFALSDLLKIVHVSNPKDADIFVDDILDTGATRNKYLEQFPNTPFYALIDKEEEDHATRFPGWIVFPWEGSAEAGITDNITRILEFIGDDPSRGGLLETPMRVAKALQFWFSGYGKNPADVLKTFEDGAEKHDQMITVKDLPIYSFCEHHMAPIFGTVTIRTARLSGSASCPGWLIFSLGGCRYRSE
jgi:hypothetical protein